MSPPRQYLLLLRRPKSEFLTPEEFDYLAIRPRDEGDLSGHQLRAHGAIRLGKWDALSSKKTALKIPERGSFARASLALDVRAYRALARGTLSAKARKLMGPIKAPPKGTRLTGKAGMLLLNTYAASGYRSWK